MYNVIIFSGQGQENASAVWVRIFTSHTEAKKFIKDNTVKGEFWSHSEMLTDGYEYSTHYDDLFE